MKALIKKDVYTLAKQMKLYLLLILIAACIPDSTISAFAIVYSGLLPLTALAYDERSKWDSLAVMMPYKKKDAVMSKYLLGYGSILISTVLNIVFACAISYIRGTAFSADYFYSVIGVMCVGIFMVSIVMPIVYKFGVEKGRMGFLAVMIIGIFFSMFADDIIVKALGSVSFSAAATIGLAAVFVIVVMAASVSLSVRFYSKKAL